MSETRQDDASLPSFFLVGAPKAGTSSIFDYLCQHPRIHRPPRKELYYFGEFGDIDGWKPTWEEYVAAYSGMPDVSISGDGTVSYLYSATAAAEINSLLPSARIVILLRHPIKRAFSHYHFKVAGGLEPLSFADALRQEDARKRSGWHFGYHYRSVGMYSAQVKRYLDIFGHDRVHVELFEDFSRQPSETVRRVLRFLELDSEVAIDTTNAVNRGRYSASSRAVRWTRLMTNSAKRWVPSRMASKLRSPVLSLVTSRSKPAIESEVWNSLAGPFNADRKILSDLLPLQFSAWDLGRR